ERMAGGAGGARAGMAEQGDRVARAGRDQNAGLHLLLDRARDAARQFDAGMKAENDRGAVARRERGPGGAEIDDRLRGGARAGLDNLAGQGGRFTGATWDHELDRTRSAVQDGGLTDTRWGDRLRALTRDEDRMIATRHTDWLPPAAEPESPPKPRT